MAEKTPTLTFTPKYSAEFRDRGVRLFREQRSNYPNDNAAYVAIASRLGCSADALWTWCSQAPREISDSNGSKIPELEIIQQLESENRELRIANDILRKASVYFAFAEIGRPFRK